MFFNRTDKHDFREITRRAKKERVATEHSNASKPVLKPSKIHVYQANQPK
jgi:hypothetical protein